MTAHQTHQRNKHMLVHGAIGAVPIGNLYEGFHAGRHLSGGSKVAGVAGVVGASVTYPIGGGVAAGVYHGYSRGTRGKKYWKKGKR